MTARWYAVPAYKGARGIDGQHHVVDEAGQLVCVCEELEHAELIARLFNDSPEAAKGRTTPGRQHSPTANASPHAVGRASIQRNGTG